MPEQIRTSGRGFTIVELLVVVTIIVVLLAILTPGLDRAMQETEAVLCATRKQQMMLGTGMYLLDNKGVYFTSPDRTYNGQPGGDWYDLVRPYVVTGAKVLPKNIQPSDVFFCPTVQASKNVFGWPMANYPRMWADMSINAFLTGYNDGSTFRATPTRANRVQPPSRVITYMESIRAYNPVWNVPDYWYVLKYPEDGTPKAYQDVLQVHGGRSHLTFVDGHLERVDPFEVSYEYYDVPLAKSKRYQLFHTPDADLNGKS
jgi:prepilin-type N-terminal cleavage/methylation domain-containing protein/prepilin-type processing-associated H-X9-DG protein